MFFMCSKSQNCQLVLPGPPIIVLSVVWPFVPPLACDGCAPTVPLCRHAVGPSPRVEVGRSQDCSRLG
jgi:hypothetical protein